MSEPFPFEVSRTQHRVLGQQIHLQFAQDFELKFTPAEASSISFALVAVRDGVSLEREIYMSPIASDAAFVGTVGDAGISIALATGALNLDWQGVTALANSLAAAID
jgi:hypothetical protein